MEFDQEYYQEEFKRLLSEEREGKFFIKKSNASFKIKKFMIKGIDSFELAEFVNRSNQAARSYWTITICYYAMLYLAKAAVLTKNYETDDYYSTQIALGYLLVPDELEKEDLDILNQAHKIFEEDYIEYFHDAGKESSVSKYGPTKIYTERRTKEIINKAREFIAKLRLFLEE